MLAEKNLAAIGNLAPYSMGGLGFDERYQGVVGSPMIFDSLIVSHLLVRGKDYEISLEADINAYSNSLVYRHPSTGKIFALPADVIQKLTFFYAGHEHSFITTGGLAFFKPLKEIRFARVLYPGEPGLLKITNKKFVEADFKGAYSVDRKYDEFITEYRYFLMGPDDLYHEVNLSKKSISKLYPDKKQLIEKFSDKASTPEDKENLAISILKAF
jgi:hypothetical protein